VKNYLQRGRGPDLGDKGGWSTTSDDGEGSDGGGHLRDREGGRREKERGVRGSCGFKFPMSRVNQTDVT
jgi:hypothetical protein